MSTHLLIHLILRYEKELETYKQQQHPLRNDDFTLNTRPSLRTEQEPSRDSLRRLRRPQASKCT